MTIILNNTHRILKPTQIATLEAQLTELEIRKTISSLPQKKAAGPDGLRAELFMAQPTKWVKVVHQVFETDVHQQKRLPRMTSESLEMLLYRKGDPKDRVNCRPISLLITMAKILSREHNNGLRKFLYNIVSQAQTGFVSGRSITENIFYIQDNNHWAKLHHPKAILLSLGFEKAYYRVDLAYLIAYLTKAGFGFRWQNLIQTIYTNRTPRLNINGH